MRALKPGEVVSTGYAIGRVITGHVRLVKGQLRVQQSNGTLDYPDHWTSGVGDYTAICRSCDREFRYGLADADHFFCPVCQAESEPPPYVPGGYGVPPRPDVGIHLAGPVTGRDTVTQRCTRCGCVLARYHAFDRPADCVVPCTFYAPGVLVERTVGGQGVLIRAGAEPTCQAKQPAEVA